MQSTDFHPVQPCATLPLQWLNRWGNQLNSHPPRLLHYRRHPNPGFPRHYPGLGLPCHSQWLARYNPLIDWSLGHLLLFRMPAPPFPVPSPITSATPFMALPSAAPITATATLTTGLDLNSAPTPSISLISSAAFACAAKLEGSETFVLAPGDLAAAKLCAAYPSDPEPPTDLSGIPSEYHSFADMFSKQEESGLAEHCPYDHHIDIEAGETPPFGPIYSLSQLELTALKDYIDDNISKGWICTSSSSAGAPILFVKKKNSALRLCVDYRGLNKITKKDCYPIPLISELLDRPSKARIYSKLDLRNTYYHV